MRAASWIAARLVLACAHLFPARKHLAALLAAPALDEAWKGLGALASIALFLLPFAWWTRLFVALRRSPWVATAGAVLLAVAHVVPAADHLPRFLAAPSYADGWRGLGATCAALWFASIALERGALVRRPLRLVTALFS